MMASTLMAAPAPMFFLESLVNVSWFFSIEVLQKEKVQVRTEYSIASASRKEDEDAHSTDIDDRLSRRWRGGCLVNLDLDDAKRGTDSESSVENVDSEDDGVSTGKGLKDLESAGPESSGGGFSLALLNYGLVVGGELVEEVVDNVGWKGGMG
jgi:hypothetical protein